AAPVLATPGVQVVLELFDKAGPTGEPASFGPADRQLAQVAAGFGAEMLRQALAQRQTHQFLLQAIQTALDVGNSVASSIQPPAPAPQAHESPPANVLDQLR